MNFDYDDDEIVGSPAMMMEDQDSGLNGVGPAAGNSKYDDDLFMMLDEIEDDPSAGGGRGVVIGEDDDDEEEDDDKFITALDDEGVHLSEVLAPDEPLPAVELLADSLDDGFPEDSEDGEDGNEGDAVLTETNLMTNASLFNPSGMGAMHAYSQQPPPPPSQQLHPSFMRRMSPPSPQRGVARHFSEGMTPLSSRPVHYPTHVQQQHQHHFLAQQQHQQQQQQYPHVQSPQRGVARHYSERIPETTPFPTMSPQRRGVNRHYSAQLVPEMGPAYFNQQQQHQSHSFSTQPCSPIPNEINIFSSSTGQTSHFTGEELQANPIAPPFRVTPEHVGNMNGNSSSLNLPDPYELQVQYQRTLQRLSKSMRRTDLTRSIVRRQRSGLSACSNHGNNNTDGDFVSAGAPGLSPSSSHHGNPYQQQAQQQQQQQHQQQFHHHQQQLTPAPAMTNHGTTAAAAASSSSSSSSMNDAHVEEARRRLYQMINGVAPPLQLH